MRKEPVYTSARQVAARRMQRGKASDYIRPFDEIKAGANVVLCLRVSIPENRAHLAHAEAALRNATAARGATVVGVVAVQWSGSYPAWLSRAVALAAPYGAKLLAETTDRFVRHPDYHPAHCQDAQARAEDLEELLYWTEGLPLVTLLHPDATPEEVRAYQSKRGQAATGRKGGRTPSLAKRVKAMRASGMSWNQIAAATGQPRSSIRDLMK